MAAADTVASYVESLRAKRVITDDQAREALAALAAAQAVDVLKKG